MGDSPVLVAEPLVGLRKCWRLIHGQTPNGKVGIPQDSVKNVLLGLSMALAPFSKLWGEGV